MRLFSQSDYPFIERRKGAYVISALALTISIGAMIYNVFTIGTWMNYGVDFTGGSLVQVDFNKPVTAAEVRRALGRHGVLLSPRQPMTADGLATFGRRFGELEINVANAYHEPNHPEMMILSNMGKDGKQLGANDAGQGWHTDMSYSKDIALANILHAQHVPHRYGKPLGETQFRNMHAACDDLPEALKQKLEGRTATHDFAKFWNMMVAKPGSTRKPLTPEQRAKKPPVSQPLFRRHPLTGRLVLYANPGYTMFIDDMDTQESGEILDFLFRHQERAEREHDREQQEDHPQDPGHRLAELVLLRPPGLRPLGERLVGLHNFRHQGSLI